MKVLIVDDDYGTLKAFEGLLLSRGHEVLLANSGLEALNIIQSKGPESGGPNCMITDNRMPGFSGLLLIEMVRKIRPNLPVILMTAYGSDAVKTQAEQLGITGYLEKPFTPDRLAEMLDR